MLLIKYILEMLNSPLPWSFFSSFSLEIYITSLLKDNNLNLPFLEQYMLKLLLLWVCPCITMFFVYYE